MARPLTYRRHGRHRNYDRVSRRTENQAEPGLGQDTQRFVDQEQVRLDTAEGAEGIFDAMHLVQGENEFFTHEEVLQTSDPTDLGLNPSVPPFSAQTQSINFPSGGSTDSFLESTPQVLGIGTAWSLAVWWKIVSLPFGGSERLVDLRPASGNADVISLYHDASSQRLRLDWADNSGTPIEITAWNSFYAGETPFWRHVLVVWTGSILLLFKDGVSAGAPDVGVNNPSISMGNTARRIGLGNLATGSNQSMEGNLAQAALWRGDITAVATNGVPAYLNTSPSSIDLNEANVPNDYVFDLDLAHWWRPGHQGSPDLGKDYAAEVFTPAIDLSVVGITDGDRQADVP